MVNYDVEKFSIFISGEQSLQEMDVKNLLQKHSLVETQETKSFVLSCSVLSAFLHVHYILVLKCADQLARACL